MLVFFSSIDTFKLWLWFDLQAVPSGEQRELLEAVVTSWFTVGRLGGFNAQNMQVHYRGSRGSSNFPYDSEQCDSSMEAMFHDLGDLEFRGSMARCWINMGTADEFALDVLINALNTFSLENMGIKKLTVGGDNNVWPIPKDNQKTQDPLLQGMDMRDY
ncbi:hypothetical protein WJX73_000822 [Symbiochloris irregularis]|uniref:Uncharacterized protein n=1 Tax=Symbiochloris irregularis TaxID=706552 RepID=A0AAW1PDG1_9CHLO